MDKRIGEFGKSWPETDIQGNRYERGNGSQAHIGEFHFAVLPIGYVDDGTLEELRKQYATPVAAVETVEPEPEAAAWVQVEVTEPEPEIAAWGQPEVVSEEPQPTASDWMPTEGFDEEPPAGGRRRR